MVMALLSVVSPLHRIRFSVNQVNPFFSNASCTLKAVSSVLALLGSVLLDFSCCVVLQPIRVIHKILNNNCFMMYE